MIGTRTPFRISFVGGGSDIKEFYSRSTGSVLSTTINKYMYIFIHKYFDQRIQIKYSKTELVDNITDIKHPIAREALNKFNLKGIDINSIADIPAGTGLGSSSSYTIGILQCLYTFKDQKVSTDQLAREACELEIDILKEPIGKQDQYAAAYGGLNVIRFFPTGEVKVDPVKITSEAYKELEDNLLLFYTGTIRSASAVLHEQNDKLVKDPAIYDSIVTMTKLVEEAKKNLCESNLEGFAKTLDENWLLKRSLAKKISTPEIDDIYMLAKKNGALGGKLLGAGGGGFFLFYCNKESQSRLRGALSRLREIKFKFDNCGAQIIYHD